MNKKIEKPKISFKYEISPNFTMHAITGVHGGLNGQGNVIVNLFSERGAIPKEEIYEVAANGSLETKPIKTEKVDSIIRDVLFGISMNPSTARAISKWLNEKADEYDKLFVQAKKKPVKLMKKAKKRTKK